MGSFDGDEASSMQEQERILVSVRMRPLNEKEVLRNEVVDWEYMNDTTIVYKNHLSPERTMYPTSYTFDRVFRCDCSTKQVYEEGAKEVVLSAVSGINSSVFAYGQTSSGKTFTMTGITEYTMGDIFDYIKKHPERDFQLKFSAMEIYNESVRDLLAADNSSLRLLDDPERGTVVETLTEITLCDWNHFKELLVVCEAQRQIGGTFLNEASSRSHQILRLTIESSTRESLGNNNFSHLTATLDFVDLAGSERASQALSAGSRLKEGSHINRSLLTLGTVIRKLSKGRTGHIPYRDSKLTRILQSSLGGNARTAIICTMSPARSYVEQSRNTLLFASCAKEVATDAHVNVVMSDKVLVKHLQRELARLENELRNANPFVKADASDILREKDSKIEELQRCLRELTLQLDLALSKIHDLQLGAEQRSPALWKRVYPRYPQLHVRQASEGYSSDTNNVTHHHSFDTSFHVSEAPRSLDRQSRHSYHDDYSLSDAEENLPPNRPFKQELIETPGYISSPKLVPLCPQVVSIHTYQETEALEKQPTNVSKSDSNIMSDQVGEQSQISYEIDSYNVPKEIGEQTPEAVRNEDFEEYCKEVQCIESEVINKVRTNTQLLEEEALLFMDHDKIRHKDDSLKQETDLQGPIGASGRLPIVDIPELKNLNCLGNRCAQSNDMSSTSKAFLVKSKYDMRYEHIDDDKSIVSLQDIQRKLSALKCDADGKVRQTSKGADDFDDTSLTNITDSGHINCTDNLTNNNKVKEVVTSQFIDQVSNFQLEDTMDEVSKSIKNTKDVGLNSQVDLDTRSTQLSDFRKLQEEIFDFWDTCNVSLVHRTYFFLLFLKGDPADTIYMEVEHRRLSFIKDTFSRGNSVVSDGRKLTPGSSKRSLHEEREMLGKLIKKRFSNQERKDLYVKWGINLDSKRRTSQLAHRLWIDNIDMDHIKESANIVAKSVRFSMPQAPKEAFGLNLGNLRPRKLFKWKQNHSLLV